MPRVCRCGCNVVRSLREASLTFTTRTGVVPVPVQYAAGFVHSREQDQGLSNVYVTSRADRICQLPGSSVGEAVLTGPT